MTDQTTGPVPPVTPADTVRAQAEARKFDAEARKYEAEARKADAEAEQARIHAAQAQREENEKLAEWKHSRIYHFTDKVMEASVRTCMRQLQSWHHEDVIAGEERRSMEIIFTSPGGSVIDGMALFDYIQTLRREGHKINTGTYGMAASMAGILLQAGDVRWMGKEAYLLIHEVSTFASGSFGDILDEVKFIEKMQNRILDIFASRSAQATGKDFKKQRAAFKKGWERTDWWLDSKDAEELGIVDEVR